MVYTLEDVLKSKKFDNITLQQSSSGNKLICVISTKDHAENFFNSALAYIEEYYKEDSTEKEKKIFANELNKIVGIFDNYLNEQVNYLKNLFVKNISDVDIKIEGEVKDIYDKARHIINSISFNKK